MKGIVIWGKTGQRNWSKISCSCY